MDEREGRGLQMMRHSLAEFLRGISDVGNFQTIL